MILKQSLLQLLTLVLVFSLNNIQASEAWELAKQENGTQVFVMDSPSSPVRSFKGVTIISSKLTALVAALDDTSAYPRLLHDCKYATLLKDISENESYTYIVTNMPWPVSDRDVVVHSLLRQDVMTKLVEIKISAASKFVALKENRVRIKTMHGRWLLTPIGKNNTRVTYEMNIDPAGDLPAWLVNTLSIDIPFYTLENLRKLVKQSRYQKADMTNVINW